jgi:AGZA family xanthine/uracil permease-like MFS transporter
MRSAKLVVANPATFVGIGNFSDPEVQAACLGLVLTLSLGLISFTVAKVAAGKFREVSILLWILTALFILRYIYLAAA